MITCNYAANGRFKKRLNRYVIACCYILGAIRRALIVIKKSTKKNQKINYSVWGKRKPNSSLQRSSSEQFTKKLFEIALLTLCQPLPLAFHIFNSPVQVDGLVLFRHWAFISIKLLVKWQEIHENILYKLRGFLWIGSVIAEVFPGFIEWYSGLILWY